MPYRSSAIEHLGRVCEVTTTTVRVAITSQSACASCHAKGACALSGSTEKMVHVNLSNPDYHVGETVKVLLKQSLGFRALVLGYLLPLVVLIIALFTYSAYMSEGRAGLLALITLLPYYAVLYLFRHRIASRFNFEIEKLE